MSGDDEELFEIDVIRIEARTRKALLLRTRDHGHRWIPRSVIRDRSSTSIVVPMWWAKKQRMEVDAA